MDEASGNISDSVGSLTGTNTGITFGTGKINNGAVMDATTDKFTFSNTTLLGGTSDFSVSMWIKWNGVSGNRIIMARRDSVPMNFDIGYGGGLFHMSVGNGGSYDTLFNVSTMDTNWHHWVITRLTTTTWVLYKDGTSVETSAVSTSIPTGHTLTIGDDNADTGGLNGTYDEIGVWSRALSSTEVTELYNGGSGLALSAFAPTNSAFLLFM